jgi:hypothetical protein
LNSSALANPSFSYTKANLTLSYDFTEDMTSQYIVVVQNDTLMLAHSDYTFYFATSIIIVKPNNNVAANFFTQ